MYRNATGFLSVFKIRYMLEADHSRSIAICKLKNRSMQLFFSNVFEISDAFAMLMAFAAIIFVMSYFRASNEKPHYDFPSYQNAI